MKIKLDTFKNIKIGFPAKWECKTEDGDDVLITYRYGIIKIYVNGKHKLNTEVDPLDLGGSMHDHEMIEILKRDGLVSEKDFNND